MKKRIHLFASAWVVGLVMAVLSMGQAKAQTIANYQVRNLLGTYTLLTGDSILNDTGDFDDDQYRVAIGFPFRYLGTTYGRLQVSSNGFIKLGASITNNSSGGAFSVGYSGAILNNTNGDNNIIAALNADLVGRNRRISTMSIKREGAAPNRTLVVQWRNLFRYSTTANFSDVDSLDFQIALQESGVIEIRYGRLAASTASPGRLQAGIRGASRNAVLTLTGNDLDSATRSNLSTATVAFSGTSMASPGRTYRIGLPEVDLTALQVILPTNSRSGCALSTTETVGVRIRNNGTQAQASGTVGVRIQGGTARVLTATFAPPLASNQEDTVYFTGANGLDLSQFTCYAVTGFVRGDSFPANDSVRTAFCLRAPTDIPGPTPVISLADSRTKGWLESDSAYDAPRDSARNVWETETFDFPNTIVYYVSTFGTTGQGQWLYRPGLRSTQAAAMRFKLAVSESFDSSPTTDVDDDTLKVMLSSDCGRTWRAVARFSSADLASGRVSNVLRTFAVPLGTAAGTFSVGFQFYDNGTIANSAYRWHLDDIEFLNAADVANDAAALAVSTVGSTRSGCQLSNNESIQVTVQNVGIQPLTQVGIGLVVDGTVVPATNVTLTPALAPSETRTLTVSGADLSQFGRHTLRAFLTGDNVRANDTTARVAFTLRPPVNVPGPSPVVSLTDAGTKGWIQTRGLTAPGDSLSFIWETATMTGFPNTLVYYVSSGATVGTTAWLYRPGVRTTGVAGLRFKLGVTAAFTGGSHHQRCR